MLWLAGLPRLAIGIRQKLRQKSVFFLFFVVRVLLVEAGGNKPWIGSVPGLVALLQKSPVDWAFTTEVRKLTSSFVECCHFAHNHST